MKLEVRSMKCEGMNAPGIKIVAMHDLKERAYLVKLIS